VLENNRATKCSVSERDVLRVVCVREKVRVRVMKRNFQRLASATKVLICSESKEIAQSEAAFAFLEAALKGLVRFFENKRGQEEL
jgi:hypothetical protein